MRFRASGVLPMDVEKIRRLIFCQQMRIKWLMGPEGIGIFYCRKELAQGSGPRLLLESVRNEMAFEAPAFELKANTLRFEEGSLNIMGIIGLGAAIDLLREVEIERIEAAGARSR